MNIRSIGVQYMRNNPGRFIESNTDHLWLRYLAYMSHQGTWADAMQAFNRWQESKSDHIRELNREASAKSKKSNPQHVQELNKNAQNRKKFECSKSREAARIKNVKPRNCLKKLLTKASKLRRLLLMEGT